MPTTRGNHSRRAGSDVISIINVAESSPGSGMSSLYVSTSCAICSSRSIRSARALSCPPPPLVGGLLLGGHPRGACHLLHLPPHRGRVLEHQRHDGSERDPADALQLDHLA